MIKNRRIISAVVAAVLLAGIFASCAAPQEIPLPSQSFQPSPSASPSPTPVPSPTPDLDEELLAFLRENLPVMDGSTSTIKLEAAVRAAVFGISPEEAELQVSHNTTYGSYYNLLEGLCDLIFTTPMSQFQIDEAGKRSGWHGSLRVCCKRKKSHRCPYRAAA